MGTRAIGPGSTAGLNATAVLKVSLRFVDSAGVVVWEMDDLTNAYSVAHVETVNLASGANTITVPPIAGTPTGKAAGVIIVPPSGNAQTLKVKGVTGDTGVSLSLTGYQILTFPASPDASFCLTAGGAISGVRLLWF